MRRISGMTTVLTSLFVLIQFVPSARAVEFSVIGSPTISVAPNQAFTINLALTNLSQDSVMAVVGEISGFAASGAIVTGGQSAAQHFVTGCSATQCFGGITSNPGGFFNDADLSMSGAYTPGDDSIVIVSALAFSETTATGAIDPGLAGIAGLHDPRDVSINLIASTPGTHTFTIGGFFTSGGMEQSITNTATFTVQVVPEPGTALFLGLGLVGLATRKRERCWKQPWQVAP